MTDSLERSEDSVLKSSIATAGYATGSLRSVVQIPVDTLSVVAASSVAVLGFAFGNANVALLAIVGLTMLLDLVVGAAKAAVDPLVEFSASRLYGGFLGKMFRLLLIPALSLVDWLYIKSPFPTPAGYEEWFPITTLGLIGLAAAELTSTLNHFRDAGVTPSAIAVIIRHLDRIRAGAEPPTRRHYDAPAIVAEQEREKHSDGGADP